MIGLKRKMKEPIGRLIWLLKKGPHQRRWRGEANHPKDVAVVVEEYLMVTPSDGCWIETGTIRHITTGKERVLVFREKKVGDWKLYMGNSSWVHNVGEATVKLSLPNGDTLTLNDVLYAPDMTCNLIFLSKVDKNGVQVNVKGGEYDFS
ncbi:hypothetical protein AMTR_s00023p00201520 [Amborella trichopoda]|uniref:Retrovirus-related Pol polyprotein from transposon TNT 1-94-like beta-barrel domain-containing protein n=1 Tax=Amborella trichopoda TaxID=13333 RepID=W1NIU6_AMBTC|nr:hypothetical protein AMTR_s00023p00201520 [Amborella trichopoda]